MVGLLLLLQDGRAILDAFERARPADDELPIYRLDWKPSLKDALAAAREDPRPIFIVCTRQLEDAGDLFVGHC